MPASDTFPILRLPSGVLDAIQSKPRPKQEYPTEPKAPKEAIIKEPTCLIAPTGNSARRYLFFIGVGLSGVGIFASAVQGRGNGGAALLGMVLIAIAILIIRAMIRSDDNDTKEHQRRMSAYYDEQRAFPSKARQAKADYEKAFKLYKHDCITYKSQFAIWKEANDALQQPANILAHRKAEAEKFWQAVPKPKLRAIDNAIKTGASEVCFAYALHTHLQGQEVLINQVVSFYETEKEGGYHPDIVVWDKETGILIDVEIDEPYVMETGEPIHYQHCPKDSKRNDAFINNGWIVVRFTEWQVVKEMTTCINAMKELILALKSNETYNSGIIEVGYIMKQIPVHPTWAKEEAKNQGIIKFRDTYLNNLALQDHTFQRIKKLMAKNIDPLLLTEVQAFINFLLKYDYDFQIKLAQTRQLAQADANTRIVTRTVITQEKVSLD